MSPQTNPHDRLPLSLRILIMPGNVRFSSNSSLSSFHICTAPIPSPGGKVAERSEVGRGMRAEIWQLPHSIRLMKVDSSGACRRRYFLWPHRKYPKKRLRGALSALLPQGEPPLRDLPRRALSFFLACIFSILSGSCVLRVASFLTTVRPKMHKD